MPDYFDSIKIKEEEKRVAGEIRKQLVTSLVAAFGVVVGLAWNDAVTTAIGTYFPFGKTGVLAKFAYAIVLTIFISVLGYYISKAVSQKAHVEEKGGQGRQEN